MPDVRHTSDPPPPSTSTPLLVPNLSSSPASWSTTNPPYSTPEQGGEAYLPNPVSLAISTPPSQRIGESQATYSPSLESSFVLPWPAYSTPYTSRHDPSPQISYSASPPMVPPYLQPVFVPGGKSRYLDYYNPMTHANSSTESPPYSSDDSHLHSHSQQTSEESARYEEQSYLSSFKSLSAAPGSVDSTLPSVFRAPTSQPSVPQLDASTSRAGSNGGYEGSYILYPPQGNASNHPPHSQDSSASLQASGILPQLGGLEGQRVDSPNSGQSHLFGVQQQQQQRRVDYYYPSTDDASTSYLPSSSFRHQEELPNSGQARFQTPRLPDPNNQRDAMYHTREDSSFSSSASDSVDSDPLLRQDLHHDGRPKRPLNAFMIYSRSRRSQLLQERPELKARDIAGALAEEWRGLDKTEKAKFQEMARVVKEAFHKNNPSYVFSRRANGTRSKKGRLMQTMPSKTSLKRGATHTAESASHSVQRDSDDSPFSPEGYSSSASSTSSFYFGRQAYPPMPAPQPRPGTSASQGSSNASECFVPSGMTPSPLQSRNSTPALPALVKSQTRRAAPTYYEASVSKPIGYRSSSASMTPASMTHSAEWQPAIHQSATRAPTRYPPYTAPPSDTANWSDQPSASFMQQPVLTSSPSEDPPLPLQADSQQPHYARSPGNSYFDNLHRSDNASSACMSGDDSRYLLHTSRPGTPADFSSSSLERDDAHNYHDARSSHGAGYLSQYRPYMTSAVMSSPTVPVQTSTRYQPLAPLPTFASPHTIPSPQPAQWAQRQILPHRTMPAAQPSSSPYDGQAAAPGNTGHASVSSAMEQSTPARPLMPMRLPSLSDMDMSPLQPNQVNQPLEPQPTPAYPPKGFFNTD